jgi:hypothetical protein
LPGVVAAPAAFASVLITTGPVQSEYREIEVPEAEPKVPLRVDRDHPQRLEGKLMLVGVLVTFLVIILVLYLINLLPLDGRARQIARVVVIIVGVISLLKYIAVF